MNDRFTRLRFPVRAICAAVGLLLAGCSSPIGVEEVPTRKAYEQVEGNVLSTGEPSSETTVILDRYQLKKLAKKSPDEVVRQLHAKAVATGERDLLFALAEFSYLAGDYYSRSANATAGRDPRDYYLGSALYAWLFLFGDGSEAPNAFDRRFRTACDLYNYGLGLAFTDGSQNGTAVRFQTGSRRLPVGEIDLQLDPRRLSTPPGTFEQVLLADRYRVRGLSVRNRRPGVGTPLICIGQMNPEFGERACISVTMLLRGPLTLAALGTDRAVGTLELHPAFDDNATVEVGQTRVPLEVDLTTALAYRLNNSKLWKLGSMQFREPAKNVRSQLLLAQPYDPDQIPVVFVHGTFSSPLTWVEMTNTLAADPVLRKRYQLWNFIYGTGNPLLYSMGDFRAALQAKVQELDPQGTNPRLHEMVVIGHSQGGLLVKSAVVDTGDKLWRAVTKRSIDDPSISDKERAEFQRLLFLKPLPSISRVVFIATPHRGGYLNEKGFVRSLGQRLVQLPGNIVSYSSEIMRLSEGTPAEDFFEGKIPTSVDGMSPDNPVLQALANIPVENGVAVHSIIAVEDENDPDGRRDGLVSYESAHVDNAESEFVVKSFHTCLNNPATIEEVRRILHLHLDELPAEKR